MRFRKVVSVVFVFLTAFNAVGLSASEVTAKIPVNSNEKELKSYIPEGKGYAAIRFIWRRSQDGDMIFRIIKEPNGNGMLTVKKIPSSKREAMSEKEFKLSNNQMENILNLKSAANFWKLPSVRGEKGFDGALWGLEIFESGQYHYTERWSPLPPYYSLISDPQTNELVMKPGTPMANQSKLSDEVALDMLCILIMMSTPNFDERIY